MSSKNRKRMQRTFNLRDEPIIQPPGTMTTDDHPFSAHGQFDQPNHGGTVMTTRTQVRRRISNGYLDKQAPSAVTHLSGRRISSGCAEKQNTSSMVTHSIGRGTYNRCSGKQQSPSLVTQHNHMNELMNTPLVGHIGATERDVMKNYPYNTLREESRIDNELMNGSYDMHNFPYNILRDDSRIENELMDASYEMNNQPYNILREESRIENELSLGSYEMRTQSNVLPREESRIENEHRNINYEMNDQSNIGPRDELRISDELRNGSFEQDHEQGSDTDMENPEKEHRGPTYMQNVWGRPSNLPRYEVTYNEFGQSIGGEESKLCHFLGSIARNGKYCPIDVTDWRAMPSKNKREMKDVVKLRFHVPLIAEKWILRSIGHKWRNWKHTLKKKYWAANVPVKDLLDKKDERVLLDQWIKLITHWNSAEAKKASRQNKDARTKKIMDQCTGKTSFAQVREILIKKLGRPPTRMEMFSACFVKPNGKSSPALSKYLEMQEYIKQLPEGSEDVVGPNDVFAQIMGHDRPGHVRMLGQGICPSDLWGELPRNKSNHLLMEQQSRIAHLEAMLLAQQGCSGSQVHSRQCVSALNPLSSQATTDLSLLVGTFVSLKSLFEPAKIVAKGCVHSTNPSTEVGGQILGSNWCEVNVKVILEPTEQLIRPYDSLQTIADTLGEMIAWPCHLVTPSED